MQEKYMEYLQNEYDGTCIFCARELFVKEYKYWLIVENRFPYNAVFSNHRMLAPKRHLKEDLNKEEMLELKFILKEEEYDYCVLNKRDRRSLPEHFHYHLLNMK